MGLNYGPPDIEYTPWIQQNHMVLGYNKAGWMKRIFRGKDSEINLYQQDNFAMYSARPVDMTTFDYWNNKSERSRFIWDNVPELIKLQTSGYPDATNVQYTMVAVTPPSSSQNKAKKSNSIAAAIRKVFLQKPINESR